MTAIVERTAHPALVAAAEVPAAGPRRPLTGGRGVLTWVLAAVSVVGVWAVFYALVLSGLQEAHTQARSYATFRQLLAKQQAPLGGPIAPGTPIALLDAPELGLRDLVVTEGTAAGDLERGPGHRRDSVLPGQVGISVVYGRSTLFGGPFRHLSRARSGDTIAVLTGQGRTTYVVSGVRRVGDPLPEPLPSGASRLVLVTTTGASSGNGFQPQAPLYLDATLKGVALPSPGGQPTAVPRSEDVLQGDNSDLMDLVLWLQLLLLVAAGTTWLASRWGAWQTYLVAAPALLAALWGVSGTAIELLPNLM